MILLVLAFETGQVFYPRKSSANFTACKGLEYEKTLKVALIFGASRFHFFFALIFAAQSGLARDEASQPVQLYLSSWS